MSDEDEFRELHESLAAETTLATEPSPSPPICADELAQDIHDLLSSVYNDRDEVMVERIFFPHTAFGMLRFRVGTASFTVEIKHDGWGGQTVQSRSMRERRQ